MGISESPLGADAIKKDLTVTRGRWQNNLSPETLEYLNLAFQNKLSQGYEIVESVDEFSASPDQDESVAQSKNYERAFSRILEISREDTDRRVFRAYEILDRSYGPKKEWDGMSQITPGDLVENPAGYTILVKIVDVTSPIEPR